jgi:tRNA(Ile)-lysidine synthase
MFDTREGLDPPPGYELCTWQVGDRMKPARLKGRSRKLSDLFIDAKIPRSERHRARVVIRPKDGVIVWAEHIGLAFGESESVVPLPNRRGEAF